MALLDVLKQLDPGNDDHWTGTGLPSVAVVTEMHGEPVTRAQISEASPGFDRDAANQALGGNQEPPKANEGEGEALEDGDTEEDAIDLIEHALAAAQTDRYRRNYELQAFIRQFHVQQVNIREVQKRIDLRNAQRVK